MGVRYLSEGNYEEAIIVFTAAIEIDSKQAPAYVGRGDAYIGSGETEENLTAARTDYENAIGLDKTIVDAYLKLSDVYESLQRQKLALEVLNNGYDITESAEIRERIKQLESSEDHWYIKDASAKFIANIHTYEDDLNAHWELYGHPRSGFMMYGIRFFPPAEIKDSIVVLEASLYAPDELEKRMGSPNNDEFYDWRLFDTEVTVSGYLSCDENYQLIENQDGMYILHPNGPYAFELQEWNFKYSSLNYIPPLE